MTILQDGGNYSDIFLTVWVACCCFVSTSLNPLVFLHNAPKPHTVQRKSFQLLSAVDFISCLLIPVVVARNAVSRVDCEGYTAQDRTTSILLCSHNATTLEKTYGVVTYTVILLPSIITAVLTSARLYHLRYPFRDHRHTAILVVLGIISAVQLLCSCGYVADTETINEEGTFTSVVVWSGPLQNVKNTDLVHTGGVHSKIWGSILVAAVPVLFQLAGFVASILTVAHMVGVSKETVGAQAHRNSAKITLKILMTNLGSFINCLVCMVYLYFYLFVMTDDASDYLLLESSWMNMAFTTLGPCFISAINPVIFVTFTPEVLLKIIGRFTTNRTTKTGARNGERRTTVIHGKGHDITSRT